MEMGGTGGDRRPPYCRLLPEDFCAYCCFSVVSPAGWATADLGPGSRAGVKQPGDVCELQTLKTFLDETYFLIVFSNW